MKKFIRIEKIALLFMVLVILKGAVAVYRIKEQKDSASKVGIHSISSDKNKSPRNANTSNYPDSAFDSSLYEFIKENADADLIKIRELYDKIIDSNLELAQRKNAVDELLSVSAGESILTSTLVVGLKKLSKEEGDGRIEMTAYLSSKLLGLYQLHNKNLTGTDTNKSVNNENDSALQGNALTTKEESDVPSDESELLLDSVLPNRLEDQKAAAVRKEMINISKMNTADEKNIQKLRSIMLDKTQPEMIRLLALERFKETNKEDKLIMMRRIVETADTESSQTLMTTVIKAMFDEGTTETHLLLDEIYAFSKDSRIREVIDFLRKK